jgi:DNA polymerase III subunit delta
LIINNADAFLAGDKVLRPYLENPSPGAVLVFCMEKLDMRRPLAKAMPSTCEVVTVGERYRDQQEVEVQRLLQKYSHLTFDREALTCLRDWVGDNLSALNTELEKIGLAHPHKSPITVADIEGLVFKQEVQSVFAFVDAVANGKRREAMDLLLRLMREGRNPLELFGLIRSQTEKLYLAAEMLEKGKAGPSICQALRVPPYFCNAFLAKAKGAGRTAPSTFFSALYESDKAIKTSLWREDLAAEMLVLKTTARA